MITLKGQNRLTLYNLIPQNGHTHKKKLPDIAE